MNDLCDFLKARGTNGPTDIGSDHVLVPDVVGPRFAPIGQSHPLTLIGASLGVGVLLIDPFSPHTSFHLFSLDTRGVRTLLFLVPRDPTLRGLQVLAQAILWHSPLGIPALETTRIQAFEIE